MKYVGFLLLTVLCSCVGVTEQGDALKAISNKYNHSSILFEGVEELRGISHNKMEVYFAPARGGSEKYSYKIYYGGEPLPQVTSSDVLNIDYRGLLRFTLTGLETAKNYLVRVDVEDQITKEITTTTKVLSESTYSHQVVDFYGISSVSNLAGTAGLDSLKVRWSHARCETEFMCSNPHDPVGYEIILLDRTNAGLNPSSFYDTSLEEDDGRVLREILFSSTINNNEAVVSGLRANTEYYVLVRAIHKGSIKNIQNPKLSGEMNNSYRLIQTLDSSLSSIAFDDTKVEVLNLSGVDALTALRVKWEPAIGVFDHYRIYYAPKTANLTEGNLDSCSMHDVISCKKIDYISTETLLAGLFPLTDYKMIFVICQTATCGDGERIIGPTLEGSTQIDDPSFNGLNSIGVATNMSEFGTLRLRFNPINTETTYIDGFVVGFKSEPSSEVTEYVRVGDFAGEYDEDTHLYLDFYDPETASEIIVHGVEYYANKTYCFKVYPFVYEEEDGEFVEKYYENENWKCINNPTYAAPTETEFQGFVDEIATNANLSVNLIWSKPSSGTYEGYEIYYRFGNSVGFTYDDAVADVNREFYGKIDIENSEVTSYTVQGVGVTEEDPITTITFGILTYYDSPYGGRIRSENNNGIVRCQFQDGVMNSCTQL